MKILITASIIIHIIRFHQPLINMLKEQGHEVHVAARVSPEEMADCKLQNVDKLINIPFRRNPFSLQNLPAYRQLRGIIDAGGYDLILCNTPAVGVLTRLAARRSRRTRGTKVFYMAHGFHFYHGAPLLNWLLYYPVEKFMCRYTDTLITINEEDTKLARERFAVNTYHVHGVGVDSARFYPVGEDVKKECRQMLGIQEDAQVILCVGELNANKNQQALIKATALVAPSCPNIRVLLAGTGATETELRKLVHKLQLDKHVSLLGYCTNIHQHIQAADIVVSCSFREGLAVNIIEAMLVGKPVVASCNRGHRELVEDGVSGFLVPPAAERVYAERIMRILNDHSLYLSMSQAAHARGQLYSVNRVMPELEHLYSSL